MANQLTGKITKLSRYQRTVTPTINANFEVIEGAFDGIDSKLIQSQQTANDAEDLARQALQILEDTPRNGDLDDVVSTIPTESQISAKIALAIDALDNIGPERLTPSVAAAIANMQALSNADIEALAQIDTGLLAGYSTELEAARDAVQDQALSLLNSLAAQGEEGEKRRAAAAAIRKETETRVTETEALARDMVAMAARVGDAESALVHESQVRATAVEAVADDVTALNTRMGNAESGITTANQTRASEDAALSQQITALDAAYKAADSSTLTAANTHADQVVATAQGALSQQISGVSTEVDGHKTSIGTLVQSVDGLRARWGVAINANGKVSGVQLNSEGGSSAFDILADVFRVSMPNGTGSKLAFAVGLVNGAATVGVSGDMFLDGTLHARALIANTVTADHINTNSLSALDANLGKARNNAGTNFVNFNAAGAQRFWQVGDQAYVQADGFACFANVKVRGDVEATTLKADAVIVGTQNINQNAAAEMLFAEDTSPQSSYVTLTFTLNEATDVKLDWKVNALYVGGGTDEGASATYQAVGYLSVDSSGYIDEINYLSTMRGGSQCSWVYKHLSAGQHTVTLYKATGGTSQLVAFIKKR